MGQRQIDEEARDALVEDGPVVAARLVAEGTSKPRFAHTRWAFDNQVLRDVDPVAVDELLEEGAVEAARRPVIDVLDRCLVTQAGEAQPGLEPAVLAFGHLAIEQQTEPFGMAELTGMGIGIELSEGARHAGQPEPVQLVKGGMRQQKEISSLVVTGAANVGMVER
jgi:hypothetical protein